MSISYVSVEMRRLVMARAESLCDYCLIAEADTGFGCEVDHIISEKHGGPTDADNLAFACVFCNQAKGERHRLDPSGNRRLGPLLQPTARSLERAFRHAG